MTRTQAALLAAMLLLLSSCYRGIVDEPAADTPAPSAPTTTTKPKGTKPTSKPVGTTPDVPTRGLPCAVQTLVDTHCATCHGASARLPLYERAHLIAPYSKDTTRTLGDVCIERIDSPDRPMPPKQPGAVPSELRDALVDWLNAGGPETRCADAEPTDPTEPTDPSGPTGPTWPTGPVVPDEFDVAPVCTSNTTWDRGDEGSSRMHPGKACITCHTARGEGPDFAVAGTLFPTAHEPDDCNGLDSTAADGARIVITDAAGTESTLKPNAAGNFMFKSSTIVFPISAKVTVGGQERVMHRTVQSGDCNACHTQDGTFGAPGRVLVAH